MSWTCFMDMHSGGGTKTDYEYIYIEADEETATTVFCNLFDEHPYSVACACCGSNFSVSSYASLEEATAYKREYGGKSVEEYLQDPFIKVVYATEITQELLKESFVDPYEAEPDWYEYDEDED